MLLRENSSGLANFPPISANLKEQVALPELYLQSFGFNERAIQIDFDLQSKPKLITQILSNCTIDKKGNQPSEEFLWELPISTRIEALLSIAFLTKDAELEIALRCEKCKEAIGIYLTQESVREFLSETNHSETITIQLHGKSLTLRKPTGSDQLVWLQKPHNDKSSTTREIIRSLISNTEREHSDQELKIFEKSIETLSQAMEQLDPLVNFNVSILCPYCEETRAYFIDLETIVLNLLREAQEDYLECIHLLALHYHWDEREIISLPLWRKKKYISLIKRGMGQ